ncbi:amino acid ABC transporter substrate-binding protein [Oceanithermus sp.]|uniref:amino acid ABC transporter substrate-binding protein n=1 Tax=Oceanithermus sp. TaxID=2268145 RepID=UPI00257DB3A1|nr:amino acid ABC transporter substrate-binding protein [Oceanithermus sp.]
MKKSWLWFLLVAALGLAQAQTVTIGLTVSKTGKYNVESVNQLNGIKLWQDWVNGQGGILVGGKRYKVELKYYDDESKAQRVQQLYSRLISQDKVDFLISPYSSGLTAKAAIISEQYGKVMVATGAASDSIFKLGYENVFQIYTPASRYLTSTIDMLKAADPNLKKIAVVYEDSKFAKAVATAARDYAQKAGFDVVLFEGYPPSTTDFGPIINKIKASGAGALVGGGHYADGATFARQLYEQQAPLKMIALLVAPASDEFAQLGDAALGVAAPSQWEPLVKYTPDFGPTPQEFTEMYQKAYGKTPAYRAAGGFAAGLVLQKAMMEAGSLDGAKVRAALDAMDLTLFFGKIKFSTDADSHGLQLGHEMVQIQWQKKNGQMVKEIVWPLDAKTADLIYPIR